MSDDENRILTERRQFGAMVAGGLTAMGGALAWAVNGLAESAGIEESETAHELVEKVNGYNTEVFDEADLKVESIGFGDYHRVTLDLDVDTYIDEMEDARELVTSEEYINMGATIFGDAVEYFRPEEQVRGFGVSYSTPNGFFEYTASQDELAGKDREEVEEYFVENATEEFLN